MKIINPPPTIRNSSIETYRIIATFAVLIVHFNGWFIGGLPEKFDFANITSFRLGQVIIEAATCICINMFLLISGYFGMQLKVKSIFRICLLLLFIFVPFYLIRIVFVHDIVFSIKSLVGRFFVISISGYFIQCYLMLMFLSPVLNAFVEKYKKRILQWCVAFVLIEFWFGCIMNIECLGYGHGYHLSHFLTIYMVGRCIYLYKDSLLKIKQYVWVIGYILCTFLIIALYWGGFSFCWDYSCPIVVVSAICSFMPFIYQKFYNKKINWIAKSTLTVYIIQVLDPVKSFLINVDYYLLENYSYIKYLLLSFVFLVIVFAVGILYEKCIMRLIVPIVNKVKF